MASATSHEAFVQIDKDAMLRVNALVQQLNETVSGRPTWEVVAALCVLLRHGLATLGYQPPHPMADVRSALELAVAHGVSVATGGAALVRTDGVH